MTGNRRNVPRWTSRISSPPLFQIQIDDIPPGKEASVSILSDFFISSTRFFAFNPALPSPWIKDASVENISLGDRVQELVVPVEDGSPLDADGVVNGKITLIGGPRDSFWGYALGTLFIRFFGIFIVLVVLMVGMMISGKVFQRIVSRTQKQGAPLEDETARLFADTAEPVAAAALVAEPPDQPSVETVLAISMALHMHFESLRPTQRVCIFAPESCAWTQQGRQQMMNARIVTLRKSKTID